MIEAIEQDLDTHGKKTLPESGPAPAERMPSANRRRQRCAKIIEDDRPRNKFDARIKGCADGNPPYGNATLKKHGQSFRCNTNFMELDAAFKAGLVPLVDLLSGSAHYANVRLRLEDPTISSQKSQIASEEWDRMLKDSDTFEHNILLAMGDRLKFGTAFMVSDSNWSVEPKWCNRFNVHVPPRTQACVDYLGELVIEEELEVCDLWKSANAARAEEAGWNVAEVRNAIRRAQPTDRYDQNHPDRSQAQAADHDAVDSESLAVVKGVHHFVKEFDGSISHYILELEGASATDSPTAESKPDGDLFAKVGEFKSWSECFWATFQDVTEGAWNGASGMGKVIIKPVEIKNRLYCTAVDLAFLRSSVNLQATTEASFGKLAIINQGPVTVYPPGVTPMNVASFVGDIESVLALDESIYRKMGRNTGVYAQVPEKGPGNPRSASEVILSNQTSATLTNSAVNRFYRDLDRLFSEMYRRTVHAPASARSERVKEFLKRCEERRVTLQDLQKQDYVRAQRNSGGGSLIMRQQNRAQMTPLVSMFPPKGQEEWVRDSVADLSTFDTASRYMPSIEAGEDITHHHQIAALENDSLVHGSPVIYSPQDNHVIHAQVHLQNATGAIQSLQQGGDPAQVLAALDMVMPHASMHIVALEGNPARQNEAKLLRQQWNDIAKLTDQLRKNVQKMQEDQQKSQQAQARAQAIQGGQDPEFRLKVAEQQADLALRQNKQNVMLSQKAEKDKANMALADAKAASEIRLSAARTLSEIEVSKAKAATEIEVSKGKADAINKEGEAKAASKQSENPTINIALKSDGEASSKKKKAKKVTFERDKKGKLVSAKVEEED
jgi:hypothetical protein